jgi:hypothetical protein
MMENVTPIKDTNFVTGFWGSDVTLNPNDLTNYDPTEVDAIFSS